MSHKHTTIEEGLERLTASIAERHSITQQDAATILMVHLRERHWPSHELVLREVPAPEDPILPGPLDGSDLGASAALPSEQANLSLEAPEDRPYGPASPPSSEDQG